MTALKAELYLLLWVVLAIVSVYGFAMLTEPLLDIGVVLK